MSDSQENERYSSYIEGLISGTFDDKSKAEIAAHLGVSGPTLWRWAKKIDWDYVKTERRKLYSKDVLEIDQAMLRASKKGDVQAAKLMYDPFDDCIQTTGTVNINGSDSELKRRANEIKSSLVAGEARIGQDMPGISPAGTA